MHSKGRQVSSRGALRRLRPPTPWSAGAKRCYSSSAPAMTGARGYGATEDGLPIFSSRGYAKLSDIIDFLRYDFIGKVVLDIGSSTGGFTACALDHGAKRIIAVEKGTNQMASPLRLDPRIDLREKTDIFNIDKSTLPHINTVVADVSFISLRPILAHVRKSIANKDTDFIIMLKPQFEAKPDELNKGVVKNEKIRRKIIKDFEFWLTSNGFIIKAKRDNLLPGKTGNLERFYYLKPSIS